MSGAKSVWLVRALVAGALAVATVSAAGAAQKTYSFGGGGSSSSYWQNKSAQPRSSSTLWDRSVSHGGASTPSPSSGGYAKPGAAPATSSGGYAKPGAGTASPSVQAPAAAVTSSGGYTKPGAAAGAASTPSASSPFAPPPSTLSPSAATSSSAAAPATPRPAASGFDRAAERQLSSQSYNRYRAEQDRFKAQPQGTLTGASDYSKHPIYSANAGHYRSYDQVYAERDMWRGSHPWMAPAYAYRSAPSFGMWDALFLWMVLDKITEPSHAAVAYNNMNDPGFQAWRAEANRMAATDAELKAKLEVMDAKLTAMQGQPQKPGALPEGVPASVALAPAVVVAGTGDGKTLVMGTGGEAGNYYPFCQGSGQMKGLRANLQEFEVQCKPTNGSVENLDGLASGGFDAIMVQSDIFNDWLGTHPGARVDALKSTVYQEYVQLLANKQAKVERIGDLDPKRHWLYLVGSGAQKTWDSFAAIDPRYAEFERAGRLRRVPSDPQALEAVANNPEAAMVFVSGLNTEMLRAANDRYGDKLTMALVDDNRLAAALDRTGHPIYAVAKIPGKLYPKLQKNRWFGLDSSVASLTVGAVFILSERWVAGHGVAALTKVEDALWRTIPEIEKKVGVGG